MTGKPKYPAEFRTRAIEMRATGMSTYDIAKQLGCTPTAVSLWTTPGYRDRQYARNKQRHAHQPPQWKIDAMERLKEIPPDTRDLSARLCGEPLPGRRAIDKQGSTA